jgi:hypothetical protein
MHSPKVVKGMSGIQVIVGDADTEEKAAVMDIEKIRKKEVRKGKDKEMPATLDSGADLVLAGATIWETTKRQFPEVVML